jgi:PAS domain-containing protein
MANPFTRRRSPPSLTQVDDLFERLKQHDPEWLASTLNERWNQISDSSKHDTHNKTAEAPQLRPVLGRNNWPSLHSIEAPDSFAWPYDVTLSTLPSDKVVSEHIKLVRSHDWVSTEVGAMDQWSEELRLCVNMCMADSRPAALWWTKDRICIYNEPYSVILGSRHPAVFGRPFSSAWPELLDSFAHNFDEVSQSGQAVSGDDACYITERNGYCEELWASWAIIPVPAGDGATGFYNAVSETTRQVISERRMSTLMLLGRCTSAAKDTQDFWKQAVRGLDPNHYDIPFVAIYAAAVSEQTMHRSSKLSDQWEAASQTSKSYSDRSSGSSDRQWTLEGMLGLPTNCSGLPSRLDAESGAALTPKFNDIVATGKITLLTLEDGTFPKGLQGVAKSRAFGDDCTAAVLCPVGPTNRKNVLGFMLIGINPRHAYDDDYKTFIKILSRQMGTSIASVVLAEEEIKRSKIAAELATQDRIRLSQQLAVTKQEAKDTEDRFRRMTELSPMAMFHFDELGNVLWANERWFDLTQHPRDSFHPLSWYNVIHEGDHALMGYEICKAVPTKGIN